MSPPTPRTRFNRPRLVQLLAAMDHGTALESGPEASFAARLADWTALTDAIALSRALAPAPAPDAAASDAAGLAAALGRLQAQLASLRTALLEVPQGTTPGRGRIRLPAAPTGAGGPAGVDFTPYRHFYLAQQRDMEANVGLLRAAARAALAGVPSMAPLPAIDAVLQKALAERERALFAGIPRTLERRFEQLRAAAQQGNAGAEQGEGLMPEGNGPTDWLQPDGWLARFRAELLALLQAELDLRVAPVTGLLETLKNEVVRSNEQ